jgi:sulfite exporter TauE/SafE
LYYKKVQLFGISSFLALFAVGVALAIISYFRKEKKLMLIKNIVLIILTLHLALLLIIAAPQVVMY